MTAQLVELFRQTPPPLVRTVLYLTQGQLGPAYEGLQTRLAEKMLVRAVAAASGMTEAAIEQRWQRLGDLGAAAEDAVAAAASHGARQQTLIARQLTVEGVMEVLHEMAGRTGERSQDKKVQLAAQLLNHATPLQARYLARIMVGTLRVGVADMTLVDALAGAFATKEDRAAVEHGYNITSDLGTIGEVLATQGLQGLSALHITPGVPIRV